MTLGKQDFMAFRKEVLERRRTKLLQSSNSNVTTASDIAAALEKSQMVAGIINETKLFSF
jgi:hypothetical protein